MHDDFTENLVVLGAFEVVQQLHVGMGQRNVQALVIPSLVDIVVLEHLFNERGVVVEEVLELLVQVIRRRIVGHVDEPTEAEVVDVSDVMVDVVLDLVDGLESVRMKDALETDLGLRMICTVLVEHVEVESADASIVVGTYLVTGDVDPVWIELAVDGLAEVGVDVEEHLVVSLQEVHDLGSDGAEGRFAASDANRGQMALAIEFGDKSHKIGGQLVGVVLEVAFLLDAERTASVAAVGDLDMDMFHPEVVHDAPLLAEQRDRGIVQFFVAFQNWVERVVLDVVNFLNHSIS